MSLSKDYLNSLFKYKDGDLYLKVRRSQNTQVGQKTGFIGNHGYKVISIHNKKYLAHRLIFAMHHGYMPKIIDHIDGNPLNNNVENLRVASDTENAFNRSIRKDNNSGVKGVCWNEPRKTWIVCAQAGKDKIRKYVKDFELAELVSIMAREKLHGKFANHGAIL